MSFILRNVYRVLLNFSQLYLVLLKWYVYCRSFTEFCWVLASFTQFHRDLMFLMEFYRVLPRFIELRPCLLHWIQVDWFLHGSFPILIESTRYLFTSIGLYWVLPSFPRSIRYCRISQPILLPFTSYKWVLLGFTGFSWVLLDFTELYRVLLGFTGFSVRTNAFGGPPLSNVPKITTLIGSPVEANGFVMALPLTSCNSSWNWNGRPSVPPSTQHPPPTHPAHWKWQKKKKRRSPAHPHPASAHLRRSGEHPNYRDGRKLGKQQKKIDNDVTWNSFLPKCTLFYLILLGIR